MNTYNQLTNVLPTTAQLSGTNATGQPFTSTPMVENDRATRGIVKTRVTIVREDQ